MQGIGKNRLHVIALMGWVLLVCAGYWTLFLYANTPGLPAEAKMNWPRDTPLETQPGLSTLIVFAHPHCPCSQATIGELARLMPALRGKMKSFVTIFSPKSRPLEWAKGQLWQSAAAIPGVQLVLDGDGIEAERFGARTSGQVFLYDPAGKLVFHGGITPERGHMGDSDGRSSILAFFETGTVAVSSTAVFGCSIRNPERAPAGEKK